MQIQQQETCARVPRAEAIAQLNDALRRGDRSAIGAKGGRYFITQGCGPACKRDPISGVIGVKKGPLIPMV